jgi:Xaa-Pro aminopeptidase
MNSMSTPITRPKSFVKARHKAIRDAMATLKLDGLLLTSPADVAYATGFTGEDSVALVGPKDIYFCTDFRYVEQVAIEAAWVKVIKREAKMTDALVEAIKQSKAKRVGFEVNFMTFGQAKALEKGLADAKLDVTLVPVEDVLVNLRKVKDDHEVAAIRKSVSIAEEAFTAIREEIKPGQTESYLAGLLILELRSRGATTTSFEPIVAGGSRSSLPHYRPKDLEIKQDQVALFDWGCIADGYCSDLTRTFALGNVGPKMKEIYKVVLDAQLAAINFIRPGVTTMQVDRVSRDVIDKAGYGEQFGHGLGHGIGRVIHELPTLRKTGGDEELRPGMVVTVEPGIYIPGVGGVRIEDDVLITHSGCEVLSTLPKRFEDCHIE